MEELIERLNKIPDAYFEFIDSVVDYADEKVRTRFSKFLQK